MIINLTPGQDKMLTTGMKILMWTSVTAAIIGILTVFIQDVSDNHSHSHAERVAKVTECVGDRNSKSCRVELENGTEQVVNGMTARGRTVYKHCWIDNDSGPWEEWCYTNYKTSNHFRKNDPSHEAAWSRFRVENPE